MLHYFIVTSRLWEQRNIFCTFRKRYFFAPTQILSQMRLPVEVSLQGLLSKSFIIFAILQSVIAGIWRKTCLISAPVSEYHLEDSNSCLGEISRVFSHPRTIFKKETHSRRYNNRLWLLILILCSTTIYRLKLSIMTMIMQSLLSSSCLAQCLVQICHHPVDLLEILLKRSLRRAFQQFSQILTHLFLLFLKNAYL